MTRVPAVTAERSPPASRMTGALSPVMGRFVDAGDALDHFAVGGDQVVRLDEDDVTALELRGRSVFPLGKRATRSDLVARSDAA